MKEFFQRSLSGILYVAFILVFTYYNLSPILLAALGLLAFKELKTLLKISSREMKIWRSMFLLSILPWFITVLLNSLFYDPVSANEYFSILNRMKIDLLIKNFFGWRWIWLSVFILYAVYTYFRNGMYTVLPFAYLTLPMIFALELDLVDEGLNLSPVLIIFIYMWVFDTFAYIVGKIIGRHPVAPAVSPGKTWEGLVGGLLGVLGISYLMFYWEIFPFEGYYSALLLGLVVGLAAFFGDLFESSLKRKAGVKDSGTIMPGHGGILDRIDSFLFSAPAFFITYISII